MQLFFLQYAKMVAGDLVMLMTSLFLYIYMWPDLIGPPPLFLSYCKAASLLCCTSCHLCSLCSSSFTDQCKNSKKDLGGLAACMTSLCLPMSHTSDLQAPCFPMGDAYDHVFNSHQDKGSEQMEVQRVNEAGKKVRRATMIYWMRRIKETRWQLDQQEDMPARWMPLMLQRWMSLSVYETVSCTSRPW